MKPAAASQQITMNVVDCSQMSEASRSFGWDVDYQQVDKGRFDSTICAALRGDAIIGKEYFNRGLIMCGSPPQGTISVILPWGKQDRGVFQGREIASSDVLFMCSGAEAVLRAPADSYSMSVSVPTKQFAEALWTYDRLQLSACLTDSRAIRFSASQILGLRDLIQDALQSSAAIDTRWSPQEFEDQLLELMAVGLSGDASGSTEPQRLQNRNQCVRKARDYIECCLAEDFGVGDVASVADVSTRSLQSAFLEVLGVRPVEYIRMRRLSKVRAALRKAQSGDETIGKIAAAHGLHHQSIFSRDYKVLFGELPSETVQPGGR